MNAASLGSRGQSVALWNWNLVSSRIHFSSEWLGLVGCEAHEIGNTHQAWLQRVHSEDLARVSRTLDLVLAEGPDAFEFRHRMLHKDGSYRWMSCRGTVERNAQGLAVRVSGCHVDVTAEALSDPQTGLPNQLLLVDRLTRSIDRARRYPGFHFALLAISIERPDGLDATATRDPLLTAVARRLETSLRVREVPPTLRKNDLVVRLAGDRFAILLDGLKEVGHTVVAADRILTELLAIYAVGSREVRVSASIGVALSATGYSHPEEALRDADTALHRAQILGGKRCEVFDTAALQSAQAELRLEADLEGALDRDEFVLFYQPIVSLGSTEIVGLEALVRWQHPVLGMILPLEFVPIAEKSRSIIPLGRWVLRETCRQLKQWQRSVPGAENLWASVNLSSVQLRHPLLIDEIVDVLGETALEPRFLMLELTEGMAIENPAAVQTLLMQIRALGVRVSVDDFGTGHSALAYLRQFPLDSLKVDRSFVNGIEANQDMASILSAVTTMARQLGLQMVAEGIEKAEQLTLIRSLNCDFGQGFLFSKPVDREHATALLHHGLPQTIVDFRRTATSTKGRYLWAMRGVFVAAAVLAVLISVGWPRVVGEDAQAPSPAAGPPPRVADIGLQEIAAPPDEPIATLWPRPTAASRSGDAAGPPSAPSPSGLLTSMRVVHQHRLGSCRGLLVVSQNGVAFVPDETSDQSKDGFNLLYHQFLHVMDGEGLTIRSAQRAYRFKSDDEAGGERLETLVESLVQLRRSAQ